MRYEDRKIRDIDVAVIGMSGRFPQASDISEYWDNIVNGVECINREESGRENYVHAYGRLDQMYSFDHQFFDIKYADAVNMDPQYRLAMEGVYHALEDAGYASAEEDRNIGLFLGADEPHYVWRNYYARQAKGISFERVSMFLQNTFTTNISYKLNLQGPSMVLRAACATSLAAVHYAASSLLNYECNMAVAGGVNLRESDEGYRIIDGVSSPAGRLRAYDEDGDGYVPGNGMGLVVLKRAEDALLDGDHIYALLKGSSIVNDGSRKAGYHASSVQGEEEVIRKAMILAEMSPCDIGYLEGHGTATPLGDRVEIQAVDQAYGHFEGSYQCRLGSVKANIGHLNVAAGIAGFMKAVLCVYHGVIPPSVNYERPNPELVKLEGKLTVNTEPILWGGEQLRAAGVSSFGFGGSNAHAILEEPERRSAEGAGREAVWLVPISGKTAKAAQRNQKNIMAYLEKNRSDIRNIAYTMQTARAFYEFRCYLLVMESGRIEVFPVRKIAEEAGEESGGLWEPHPDVDYKTLRALGDIWCKGRSVKWDALYRDMPKKIPLPLYSFETNELIAAEPAAAAAKREKYVVVNGLSDERIALTKYLSSRKNAEIIIADRSGNDIAATDPAHLYEQLADMDEKLNDKYKVTLLGAEKQAVVLMDELCASCTVRFFEAADPQKKCFGRGLTREEMMEQMKVKAEFKDFFCFLLTILEKHGIAGIRDNGYVWLKKESHVRQADQILNEILDRYLGYGAFAELLVDCSDAYPAVFTGVIPANEVLYPGGSYSRLKKIGNDATTEIKYCELLANAVRLQAEKSKSPLRVLEIGGGTGQLTDKVMAQCEDKDIEYWFTDVGYSFVSAYEKKAGSRMAGMHFQKLDITRDLRVQGLKAGYFDVIIGDSVLHVADDMRKAMDNLLQVLRDGGMIGLVQICLTYDIQQMVFGLAPGWWNYCKDPLDRHAPYYNIKQWRTFFESCGLEEVCSYPEQDAPDKTNAVMVLGRKSGIRTNLLKQQNTDISICPYRGDKGETWEEFIERLKRLHADAEFIEDESAAAGEINAAKEEGEPDQASAEISGYSSIEAGLIGIAREILNISEIKPEEDLLDYDFDSLSLLMFAAKVKERFRVEISIGDIYELETIHETAGYIERSTGEKQQSQSAAEPAKCPEDLLNDILNGLD